VSRYQKGKTNLDLTEATVSDWQWYQLGHMQVCTSLQTDNHASTPPLSFLQAGCPSCRPTNSWCCKLKLHNVDMHYVHRESKKQDTILLSVTSPNINRFSKIFHVRLSRKFVTKSYLNTPPYHHTLNVLLHYLVKYICSKNRDASGVSEANFYARLSHSNTVLK